MTKNKKTMSFFLSSLPAEKIAQKGEKLALNVFNIAAERIPAYKKVLEENKVNASEIKTIEDFKKLPIIDKKNYFKSNKVEDLCLDGTLHDKYLIDRSSGYSGEPSYWPCSIDEDVGYPKYMEIAYQQFYNIDTKPTLMIITLALGSWVGGEKISWATRQIAINGKNPFTVMTPGVNLDETLEIVQNFKDKYEQIVIVGYPPFIKRIIDEGAERGVGWKDINVKLGVGGEGYSEDWREYLRKKIGAEKNDLMCISGGYGAADLGMSVAREYPISIMIRKLANEKPELAKDLFGEDNIPSLCQYSPSSFYIEEVDKELVFTAMTGAPIVRYSIRDRGGLISFNKILEITKKHGYDVIEMLNKKGYTKKDIWHLPFIYIYGRSDGTAHFNGANIYVENVQAALNDPRLIDTNTNNFHMHVGSDDKQDQELVLDIELIHNIKPSQELKLKYKKIIIEILRETNSEYNLLHDKMGDQVHPTINLCLFGDEEKFSKHTIKNIYTESNGS